MLASVSVDDGEQTERLVCRVVGRSSATKNVVVVFEVEEEGRKKVARSTCFRGSSVLRSTTQLHDLKT